MYAAGSAHLGNDANPFFDFKRSAYYDQGGQVTGSRAGQGRYFSSKTADEPVTPASVMAVSLGALSRNQKAQVAPGMSMSQLDSMVQTSLRMQAIRNDASIPEEVKKEAAGPVGEGEQGCPGHRQYQG